MFLRKNTVAIDFGEVLGDALGVFGGPFVLASQPLVFGVVSEKGAQSTLRLLANDGLQDSLAENAALSKAGVAWEFSKTILGSNGLEW